MAQQTLAPSQAPTEKTYGGDEVSAVVLDPGYCTTRAGFAGEDCPKSVLPSFYVHSSDPLSDRFGDEYFVPRRGIEVRNYMSYDSVVEDWDAATKLWENMLFERLLPPKPGNPVKNGLNDDKSGTAAAAAAKEDGEGDVTMGDDAPSGANGSNGNVAERGGEDDAEEQEKALSDTPVLVTEAAWNTPKAREKTVEIMIENWGVPAFWLSKTPVLAAFAAGKASALVIDVGGSGTSVACVHDGMCLRRSIQRSPAGGLWLSAQVRAMLSSGGPNGDAKVDIVPTFLVEHKTPVDAGLPAQYRARQFPFAIHPTFRAYEDERLFTEFKESVVETWRGPPSGISAAMQGLPGMNPGIPFFKLQDPRAEEAARNIPGRVFEMPDGSNQMWRTERFKIAEGLWDDTAAYPTAPVAGSTPPPAAGAEEGATTTAGAAAAASAPPWTGRLTKAQTIPELVRAALNSVDVDLRPNLLQNVVVTGSTTLMTGFSDRLNIELQAAYPNARIKLHAAGLVSERRFGAWIGGSILASLGTFHQMWISKQEYEENGPSIVEKRCK